VVVVVVVVASRLPRGQRESKAGALSVGPYRFLSL
jgi:hypothetical protein